LVVRGQSQSALIFNLLQHPCFFACLRGGFYAVTGKSRRFFPHKTYLKGEEMDTKPIVLDECVCPAPKFRRITDIFIVKPS